MAVNISEYKSLLLSPPGDARFKSGGISKFDLRIGLSTSQAGLADISGSNLHSYPFTMNDLNGKSVSGQKSLRSACDLCHQGKVKCGGGIPCEGCHKLGLKCTYSISNRTGRPKGVKNKRTLERIKQLRAANGSEQQERAPDSVSRVYTGNLHGGRGADRILPL